MLKDNAKYKIAKVDSDFVYLENERLVPQIKFFLSTFNFQNLAMFLFVDIRCKYPKWTGLVVTEQMAIYCAFNGSAKF